MRCIVRGLLSLTVLLAACDKRPQSEAATTGDPSAAAEASAPQAAAPQVNVPMMIMPLALTLPAGWKLDPPLNPTFLEGPMPDGNVEISLTLMDAMIKRNQKLFIDGAIAEGEKHPNRIHIHQGTTGSGLATLERITYLTSPGEPAMTPGTTLPSQELSWNIIVFVPYEQKLIPCSFDLLGLTQKQFDDDQSAVRAMIDSAEAVKTPAFQ